MHFSTLPSPVTKLDQTNLRKATPNLDLSQTALRPLTGPNLNITCFSLKNSQTVLSIAQARQKNLNTDVSLSVSAWLSAAKVRPQSQESRSSEPEARRPGDCCWEREFCDFSHQVLLAQQWRLPFHLCHIRLHHDQFRWLLLSGGNTFQMVRQGCSNATQGQMAKSGPGCATHVQGPEQGTRRGISCRSALLSELGCQKTGSVSRQGPKMLRHAAAGHHLRHMSQDLQRKQTKTF